MSGAGIWPLVAIAAFGGDLFGDRGEVVAERFFARLQRFHRFAALRLGSLQFGEARLRFLAGGRDFALHRRHRIAGFFDFGPLLGQPVDRRANLVAQRLHPFDHRVVVALDPVQVFGLGRHLGPVFGFENRVDDVGGASLVDRDQAAAEDAEGAVQLFADLFQVRFFGFERRRRAVELGLLFGQFGLDRGLLAAQFGDFADHRVDRLVLFGDRFRQGAGVGANPFQLVARRFQLFLRRLGRGGPRPGNGNGAESRQKQRGQDQGAAANRARRGTEQHDGAG